MSATIFEAGHVCDGSYLIDRLWARSAATESYVAKHITTGQEVVLTCSQLNHGATSAKLRKFFLSKAAKLRSIKEVDSPNVLAFGVTDRGVYWVVREHLAGAVPVWSLFKRDRLSLRAHLGLNAGLLSGIPLTYTTLIVVVAYMVADVLREFAKFGVYHGGLDLARTVVCRDDGLIVVLETGYRDLFGPDHFDHSPDMEWCAEPEARETIDAQIDIYSLGVGLTAILTRGMMFHRLGTMKTAIDQVARLRDPDRSKRLANWDEVRSLFKTAFAQLQGQPNGEPKSGFRPKAEDGDGAETTRSPVSLPIEREFSKLTPRALEAPAPAPVSVEVDVDELAAGAPSSESGEAEPTPRVLDVPAPVSIDVDVNERAAGARPSESDEAPTPRVPVSVSIRATYPASAPVAVSAMGRRPKREKVPTSRLLAVAASCVTVFVGIVALWPVPLLEDRGFGGPSVIDKSRRDIEVPDGRDGDQETAPYRPEYSPQRLIVKNGERARQRSGVQNSLQWTAAFDTATPSRRIQDRANAAAKWFPRAEPQQ